MRTLVLVAALSVSTAVAVSCTDSPASPVGGPGELYALRSIGDDPVPAPAYAIDGFTLEVLADSLLLRGDGTGREVLVAREMYPTGPTAPRRRVIDFTYTRHGDSIAVTLPCNDNPGASNACIAPPHYAGHFMPAGIRFALWLGYTTPMVFEFVER